MERRPAGAHPVAPNLGNTDYAYANHRNTDSVYVEQRDTDSVYAIHRHLCFRHRQCLHLTYSKCVGTTYKLCTCDIEFVCLMHI